MKTRKQRALIGAGLASLAMTAPPAWADVSEETRPILAAELVAEGFEKPVDFVPDPEEPTRWYIVEQGGTIRIVEDGERLDDPFFEIDRSNFTDRGWEQGLLGLAFDPDYADNSYFYLNYTGSDDATYVSRFKAESPHRADPATEEVLLNIDQPFRNHNGGCIRFGPDGMLYIGMGDGGAAHDPRDHGQRLETLHGAMLRIDVSSEPEGSLPYNIPRDNPFRAMPEARSEIWAYGLRNPWKFSFDGQGRIWIADVGQDHVEEVNVERASRGGLNYGWAFKEGPDRFTQGRDRRAGRAVDGPLPSGLIDPVWYYRHQRNGSITGGYFYEGERVPWLRDRYICADFMTGEFWTFRLDDNGEAEDVVDHSDEFIEALGERGRLQSVSSFGRDLDNELYFLDHRGGRLFRIVQREP